MKILTSKLILPLLFLLALDLKGLDAGNTCRKQNSAAVGSQRLNNGKKPMTAKEGIAGASSSHLAADTTRECYCGKKTIVEKMTFNLKNKDKEFASTELFVVKPRIYNGKNGEVKIYHAIWPEKERCVAIKFLIKNSDETKDAVRKEIAVLEHFYGPGENKKINGPIRIVEYFGHEEKTMQIGNQSHEFESIVLELGEMNLLKYYNESIKGQKNKVKHLTEILISAAEALKQLHDENYVHLDIKPENFVRTGKREQNKPPVFKLIDFGTSEFMENFEIINISKEILGTNMYIAPEIDRNESNKVSKKADIYSFGVIIYKLIYSPRKYIQKMDLKVLGKRGQNFKHLNHLIEMCTNPKLDSRPTIEEVLEILKEELTKFK